MGFLAKLFGKRDDVQPQAAPAPEAPVRGGQRHQASIVNGKSR